MSSKRRNAASTKKTASEDVGFKPQPAKVSRSEQVLHARQDSKVLRSRGSRQGTPAISDNNTPSGNSTAAAPAAPASQMVKVIQPPSNNPSATPATSQRSPVSTTTLSAPSKAASDPLAQTPASGLSASSPNDPEVNPGPSARRERVVYGERGLEMWLYSDEEPMRDDPDGDHTESSPTSDNDPDYVDTSGYHEEPSFAPAPPPLMPGLPPTPQPTPPREIAPPPETVPPPTQQKVTKGKRKAKKVVVDIPDEDLDEEPSAFLIPCWIATGSIGLRKQVVVDSSDTFQHVRSKIAAKLGILESSLELAYVLSFLKSTDSAPRALEDSEDWSALVSTASLYRNKPTTKRNHLQDTWTVQMMQKHEVVLKNQASNSKGAKAAARAAVPSVAPASRDRAPSEDPASDAVERKLVELTNRIGCSNHPGDLCLLPSLIALPIMRQYGVEEDHVRLSDAESRAWAASLIEHRSTFDNPSVELIKEICSRAAGSQKLKGNFRKDQATGSSLVPETPSRYQFRADPIASTSGTGAPLMLGNAGKVPGEQSLCEWLIAVDLDEKRSRRKGDLENFTDLVDIFESEGISTIDDLLAAGVSGLKAMGGIKLATASWLLSFAREDTGKSA